MIHMTPTIITLSKGSLTEEELLNQPAIKKHLRYDTYIRVNDILLTTMFRDSRTHKYARDLESMTDLLKFIEWQVASNSIALRNGVIIRPSHYNQPLPGMGVVTVEELAQEVFLKLIRQSPKIITLAYLTSTIRCIGIDCKRKAVLRHTASLSLLQGKDEYGYYRSETYEQEVQDRFTLDPEASLVHEKLVKALSPVEQKVLFGLLGNLDGQSLADEIGIHRRTIYLVKNRIKSVMGDHL